MSSDTGEQRLMRIFPLKILGPNCRNQGGAAHRFSLPGSHANVHAILKPRIELPSIMRRLKGTSLQPIEYSAGRIAGSLDSM
jgi:hypothetical protein